MCSNPLAKKCLGCKLMIKTAAEASWKLDFTKKLSKNYSKLLVPAKIRRQAWPLHTCLKDPSTAPVGVRRAYFTKTRLLWSKQKDVAAPDHAPVVSEAPRLLITNYCPWLPYDGTVVPRFAAAVSVLSAPNPIVVFGKRATSLCPKAGLASTNPLSQLALPEAQKEPREVHPSGGSG